MVFHLRLVMSFKTREWWEEAIHKPNNWQVWWRRWEGNSASKGSSRSFCQKSEERGMDSSPTKLPTRCSAVSGVDNAEPIDLFWLKKKMVFFLAGFRKTALRGITVRCEKGLRWVLKMRRVGAAQTQEEEEEARNGFKTKAFVSFPNKLLVCSMTF